MTRQGQRRSGQPGKGRFYRYADLEAAGVPWSRKHINHLEKIGKFPTRIWLAANTVAWLTSEIDAYVDQRVAARRAAVRTAGPACVQPGLGHNGGPLLDNEPATSKPQPTAS